MTGWRGWAVAALMLAALASPARAQDTVPWNPGLMEAAVSSCAGGAAVGAIVALGGGMTPPVPTAVLFCGLSVSATLAANLAARTWRATTSLLW